MGAEYPVALCDLGIFMNQTAEPVPPQDPDILAHSGRMLTPSGRPLAQRPVRTMNVIVLDILTQDQSQVPLTRYQHPVQAVTPCTCNPVPLGNSVSWCEFGFCCGIGSVAGTISGCCCRSYITW